MRPTPWLPLGLSAGELRLAHTLTTGQAFGWARSGDEAYVGCVGRFGVRLREHPRTRACEWRAAPGDDRAAVEAALADYFRSSTSFASLAAEWGAADARLAAVAERLEGVRVLRQPPWECLVSFICSSNNNISRITGMLSRLRARYGAPVALDGDDAVVHAFPSVAALAAADAADLRDLGFGYRAPYVVRTAAHVLAKGGEPWLEGLRAGDRHAAKAALLECAGVGPKVADCVALFSLDQADAVPVDTHVWRIARRDYDPSLDERASLTPAVYEAVGDLFRARFGATAGWAHCLLFAAELPAFADKLPPALVAEMRAFRDAEKAEKAAARDAKKARQKAAADAAPTPAKKSPSKTAAAAPAEGGTPPKRRKPRGT